MDLGFVMTKVLAIVTLVGNAAVILLFLTFLFRRASYERMMRFLATHGMPLAFLFSTLSTVGSIVYSEVIGFPACILCWVQRIFMYPLMFILFLAVWRRESVVAPYALLLALVGGAVSLYQWVKDMTHVYGGIIIPCPAVAGLPSCDTVYVNEFGYITIAMLALNAFILIAIKMYATIKYSDNK